ncbi:MAG: class I SAM-dependent methyltransferase [bacterium]
MSAKELQGEYYFANFPRRFRFPKTRYNLNIVNYVDKFIGQVPAGATVLDACCGDGYLGSRYLTTHRVLGFDCETEAVSHCSKAYPKGRYFLASAYALPLEDNSVDAIILSMAIEHFREPSRAVADLRRVLRPGGIIIVTTPNESSWLWILIKHTWFRFFEGACKPYKKDIHPSPLNDASLKGLFPATGFELLDLSKMTAATTLALAARKR